MAKPIFILEVPSKLSYEQVNEIKSKLQNQLFDYHCLVITNQNEDIKHKAYTNKNMKEIDYSELVESIKKQHQL